ncbi:MAG: ATP-binding protein [Spirochaetales bacterium]|nr:ATP-binding protein [Spirochaetales bacterium]
MIKRNIEAELFQAAKEYPVITILGPRQSGKTTLAKMCFPDYVYANLEDPELRALAVNDPKSFLKMYQAPVVIDEIQNVPELLSWIQVIVDESPRTKAQFVLTGSHQLMLGEAVSQSLAGCTAVLTLPPFSFKEMGSEYMKSDRNILMLNGFMPRLHEQDIRPRRFYSDYFQTYVERDVRKLMAIENQQAFELFLKLLAGRAGQEINFSSLSNQVGISSPQLKKWLSILEASFIVFRLPPFHSNFGKRLTKSPKIYFMEVGLAVYLLGIETAEQLERDPVFGSLFENMVIADIYKERLNRGYEPSLYFFRDHHQNEVDLLYPAGSSHLPVEIKSSRTYREDFLKNIRYFQKLAGMDKDGLLIYDGELEFDSGNIRIRNFRNVFS